MIPCKGCNRHIRLGEAACPFCEKPTRILFMRPPNRFVNMLLLVATPAVLAACYGGAPKGYDSGDTGPRYTDLDSDGYMSDVDCNDEDATIYPGATEVCDDEIDNDCDELIDIQDDDCTTTGDGGTSPGPGGGTDDTGDTGS